MPASKFNLFKFTELRNAFARLIWPSNCPLMNETPYTLIRIAEGAWQKAGFRVGGKAVTVLISAKKMGGGGFIKKNLKHICPFKKAFTQEPGEDETSSSQKRSQTQKRGCPRSVSPPHSTPYHEKPYAVCVCVCGCLGRASSLCSPPRAVKPD